MVAMGGQTPPQVVEPQTLFYAPLSKPAPGSAGPTGTWRDMRPVIDESRCTRCLLCWLYCPDDVISMEPVGPGSKEIPVIDYEYCKGCGICAQVCPTKAIEMVPEETGAVA